MPEIPRTRLLAGALAALALVAPARSPFDPLNARDATTFPRAHGSHPGATTEWWYVTGLLHGSGRRMGFELALFRFRLAARDSGAARDATSARALSDPADARRAPRSAWRPGDLYFAHYAISDLEGRFFRYDERIGRTGVGLAGADSTDLDVWVRDWSLRRVADGAMELRAAGELGALALTLSTRRARPVAWGPDYLSPKSADGARFSRYHSEPRLAARGTYAAPGGTAQPVAGTAWYDHEWSGGTLDPDLGGWDWFGLRLGDGRSLMIYRMRGTEGETLHGFGGLVERDGSVRTLGAGEIRLSPGRRWESPRSGASYPVAWRIRIEPAGRTGEAIDLTLEAALSDQELMTPRSTRVTYWEGVVTGTADVAGAKERVEGYMELTGYAAGQVLGDVSTSEPRGR